MLSGAGRGQEDLLLCLWVEDGWFEAASPGPESDWTLGLGEAARLLHTYRLNQPSLHALGERELLHVNVEHQATRRPCSFTATGLEERQVERRDGWVIAVVSGSG